MDKKIRKPSSITHPFGRLLTQQEKKFGYLPISKNGSSSFKLVPHFELNEWVSIKGFQNKPIYCAFRNPIDRFFSSVPETLKRFRIVGDPRQLGKNLLISYDVSEELKKLCNKTPQHFIYGFLDIVEWSFFDAHHEPQATFVLDSNGKAYNDNIDVFLLDRMSETIKTVAVRHGINLSSYNEKANSRLGVTGALTTTKDFIKRQIALQQVGPIDEKAHKSIVLLINASININRESEAAMIYKSILPFKKDKVILEKLRNIYALDIHVFETLQANSQLFTPLKTLLK